MLAPLIVPGNTSRDDTAWFAKIRHDNLLIVVIRRLSHVQGRRPWMRERLPRADTENTQSRGWR